MLLNLILNSWRSFSSKTSMDMKNCSNSSQNEGFCKKLLKKIIEIKAKIIPQILTHYLFISSNLKVFFTKEHIKNR